MTEQNECYVELSSFNDLARFACAFREYPKRVFSQEYNGKRILSSSITLGNTLIVFYSSIPKDGRYVSYQVSSGNEICEVVESTKDISHYAPIIHAESEISPLSEKTKEITDQFHPIKLKDLGSLARLTYDPEFPEEPDLTLYAVPHKYSWMLGYVTSLEMDEFYYNFNYVELDSEPVKNFMKYQGNYGQDPVFVNNFDHGFTYLPIVKIKEDHPLFGF